MCINAKVNERIWLENDTAILNLPTYLEGTYLFQMPYRVPKGSNFFIRAEGRADLFICTSTDIRKTWSPDKLISEPYSFEKRQESLRTSNGHLLIFEKKNFGFITLPKVETDVSIFAVFIKTYKK